MNKQIEELNKLVDELKLVRTYQEIIPLINLKDKLVRKIRENREKIMMGDMK